MSGAMELANVCPTEDAISLLLELLVDPKLPSTPNAGKAPSKEDQESVGKQVHAVVLLYNYHYRKLHPQLEFLSRERFCTLSVTSRPSLAEFLGVMQPSHETETPKLSVTGEYIRRACQISMDLDVSREFPIMDGWPVSKVAVFLVDSKKENCLMQFGSVTQGVWSVIEKDVDVLIGSSDSPIGSSQVYLKKNAFRKANDEKQLAFSAAKEAIVALKPGIDINQKDLMVLEHHLSYSTSKEKAAARFYIMQCTQANIDGAMQCPIKDIINSLQGPFFVKESLGWMCTAPVEYFHLLPYAQMLSDWFSSVPRQNQESKIVKVDSHKAYKHYEPKVSKVLEGPGDSGTEVVGFKPSAGSLKQDDNIHSGDKVHNSSNADPGSQVASHLLKNSCISASNAGNIISDSAEQSENVDCYLVDMIHDTDEPRPMEVDGLASVLAEGKVTRSIMSGAMDLANVCPTEDAISLLLELLVDPKLPYTPNAGKAPSKEDQESVGKQVHAVVLLYNYHYRKLHPQLEFLSREKFCMLAVTSRPSLAAYLGVMQPSHETETPKLSVMGEYIRRACQISMDLDVSRKFPNIDGWPVSKVAVFLVDSKKENCLMQFGSVTQGVWSVIEKDVDVLIGSSDSPIGSSQVYRKNNAFKKANDEKQLAFSAVKEAIVALKPGIDINQKDLKILEHHLSYSTSKEKAAARFYIMQCTQANIDGAMQCPIKDIINSLQGPFLVKESLGWMYTAPVEYFHLLPYAQMLSDWFSSILPSNSVPRQSQESKIVKVDSHEAYKHCEPKVSKVLEGPGDSGTEVFGFNPSAGSLKQDDSIHSGNKVHNSSNADPGSQVASHLLKNSCISASNAGNIISDSAEQSENVDCYLVDMIHDTDEPRPMEVDGLASVLAEGKGKSKTITSGVQAENYGKMTSFVDQTKVVESLISERYIESKGGDVGIVNKEQNISSDLNTMRNHDHGAIICHSNSNISVTPQSTARYGEKVLAVLAAKDKEITQAAVNAILSKRNEAVLQLRVLKDQIANYDKDRQTVLDGGESSVPLKVELLIESCTKMPLEGNRGNQHGVDHCSCQSGKRKRMSDSGVNLQSPCKVLDNVCLENEWMLPTYRVWAHDGGTRANVTLKDMKAELHVEGDVRPLAHEARESAAAKMLSLLAASPADY